MLITVGKWQGERVERDVIQQKIQAYYLKKKKKERKDLPKVTELVTRELGYECRLSGSNTYQLNL